MSVIQAEGLTDLAISEATKNKPPGWIVTARPFEQSKGKFAPEQLAMIEKQTGGWDAAKYALGFQEHHLDEWRQHHYAVLEVGPGQGVSFQQLFKRGIDIYALEPSLLYDKKGTYTDKRLKNARKRLGQRRFKGRVAAANAVDTSYAFPGKVFDLAFAIGPNFQNFCQTEYQFLSQTIGIMSSLKIASHSFLAFEIYGDGSIEINMQAERFGQAKKFHILRFLVDHGIRFEQQPNYSEGDGSMVIKIYRLSNDNLDTLKVLNEALNTDLSKYVGPY